ncbi:hypothetical protein [Lichenibacterium dinghuense]|uniref:hypothetical protein n=1 Tax=Lichenibacterium dinghuense TaxID=2895977 RepID=UPI001F3C4F54|nr:hypothetical protein [Lichenibacterium sp. 6Y81]
MGEHKRLTPEGRAARAASAHADAVEASRDRMRKAIDGLTHAVRWRMRDLSPEEMAVALGTTVGVFAASAGGPSGAGSIAGRVDEVARAVIEQAGEAA